MQGRGKLEAVEKLGGVVIEGHPTAPELKSQDDPKLNPRMEFVNLCTVKGERKRLLTHHPVAPSRPNIKFRGDQSSHLHSPDTKCKQVGRQKLSSLVQNE